MRIIFYVLAGLLAVALIIACAVFGLPAYLASGTAPALDVPNFESDDGWILRPETPPPAVWEAGWAIDVIIVPQVPNTFDQAGLVSSETPGLETYWRARNEELGALFERHGAAVYMPSLRIPSQASQSPDWTAGRSDLERALQTYFERDNRGRAVMFYTEGESSTLLGALPDSLRAAGADEASDRILILASAGQSLKTDLLVSDGLANARPLILPLENQRSVTTLLAWPNSAEPLAIPGDGNAVDAQIEEAFSAAIERARTNARKSVEPFGAFETVREAPVNRPCEAGLRCQRD